MRRPTQVAIVLAAIIAAACVPGASGDGAGSGAASTVESSGSSTASIAAESGSSSTTSASVGSAPSSVSTNPSVAPAPVDPCAAPLPRRPPDPNRPVYVVDMAVDLATNQVSGTLRGEFVPDLDIDRLVLRLWPNGPIQAQAGSGLTVGNVTVNAEIARWSEPEPTRLEGLFAKTVPAGTRMAFVVPFVLAMGVGAEDRVGAGAGWARMGSFLPLLAWEPGVGWATDPPTTNFAEASVFPAADFDLGVTATDGHDILATGVRGDDGRWRSTGARDVAVTVGRFDIVTGKAQLPDGSDVDVTVGVHDTVGESPVMYATRVIDAIEQFSARFGPYPWPTYSLSITPELGGGIEYPSHVMQGPNTQGRTTSHEVAHMWFYGLVGNNQGRDPFIDEGLASYAEFTFEGRLDLLTVPLAVTGRTGEGMTLWDRRGDYYEGVYRQGALAAAQLGPAARVDCALARFAARHAYDIATETDFVDAMTEVFPDAEDKLRFFGIAKAG